ncbi:Transcription initiation factor TFIID subunit 2 [Lecanosticta acicola]|uniref:Transcription initiation factor TFIID subunit 2 n=1 Tax=Lecanosticta acicola TaxID=111012 RepID=A0AAI9ECQ5_9PEZI|nr:Transcription initiation factor TFIID subunit 2 [Lecanosticta acicola]
MELQTQQGPAPRQYDVLKQRLDLDIDFPTRSLKGSAEITIQPLAKDLCSVQLHCRQCKPTQIHAGGIAASWEYDEPYRRSQMSAKSTVYQHGMLKSRIGDSLRPAPAPQLTINLPAKLKIQELHVDPATSLPLYNGTPSLQKQENDAMAIAETPVAEKMQQQMPQFAPLKLTIEFEVASFRDGIHWVGCMDGDKRFPYMYTKLDPFPGAASSIFPCLDDATSRCSWEIAIRCPRTLGDAFKKPTSAAVPADHQADIAPDGDVEMVNGTDATAKSKPQEARTPVEYLTVLSDDEAALELAVLCVGQQVDDVADTEDDTRHTVSFSLDNTIAARHIGFAIGPFEHVDLTATRANEEESKLGANAVKVDAYCLPGQTDELDNTCFPMCQALDFISVNFGRYPYPNYQMLFVDDLVHDTTAAAGLSICSKRLLFPESIIEPIHRNTSILVRAVAEQWSGVNIIPKEPTDSWTIAGIAGYVTDVFMKKLSGNNQYRWEQRQASEKVYELDVDRPSMHQLGNLMHLDQSIRDFIDLKSALILGILDRRLMKTSGSTGVTRIINKIFLNATTGSLDNGELSTSDFQRTCEKLGHNKLESFFRQWVFGAGCPIFQCQQRFNKKKLVVEMTITQRQLERQTKPPFEPSNFMREVKEHVQEVWAPEPQTVFTGPMTIRIHEADGTPYEHIVEIKEPVTKLEIPYNTKYKRLKRSKRQRERAMAEGNANGEDGEPNFLVCLGDILDSSEEMKEWNLEDWSKEDEDRMSQESYEWIRMDADFEWIGKIHFVMPLYMYVSQLQQDRDIVAQYESMKYLLAANPHHVSLSILVRTLMDERYFYGIRVMAAEGIAMLAKDKLLDVGQSLLRKAFQEMFCEGDLMRPNDFTNRVTFIMQCAIPRAMSQLRDADGKVPMEVRQFFVDRLRYNENSDNLYSDCHYIATLMECLADSLVISHRLIKPPEPTYQFNFGEEEPEEPEEPYNPDADFEENAVSEIERYRRIDEWESTYHNIYSTTAIECLQKLVKADIVSNKTKELFQYTRVSTADNVRLQAFKCMNELGLTRRMTMTKHLLYSLADDRSPYFRDRMLRLLGEALGHIALGEDEVAKVEAAPAPTDGLVLEQEATNETRRIEATRKLTPEGALAALKVTLQNEDTFKQSLWYAATSPDIALDEIGAFCDIAALVYEPITSHTVILKLPRPYRCVHEGNCRMRFYQHGAYRIAPSKSPGLAWDDYRLLEEHGLRYSGPLAQETHKQLRQRDKQHAQREQNEGFKLRIQTANGAIDKSMPPPAPVAVTPTGERSGFKLNLGAGKKRASGAGLLREGSAKVPKLSKPSTPSGLSRKNSFAARTGPTVVLKLSKLSKTGFMRAQEILGSPPQPGRGLAGRSPSIAMQKSRAGTPNMPQQPSTFAHPSMLNSPSGGGSGSPPSSFSAPMPVNLNVGGFRSFGGAPDAIANTSFTASPSADTPKAESASPVGVNGSSKSPPALTSLTSLTSMSPPAVGNGGMAPPPSKKKITLKLGKNTASGSGSHPGPKENGSQNHMSS